jgi:polysaccharide pyruvyl transferase WcaK-like protein
VTEPPTSPVHHPRPLDPKTWIVLGSANGSTNLGDESMWEAAVVALRDEVGPTSVVTDGDPGWEPPLGDVTVLPYLHPTLRRGAWIPDGLKRLRLINLTERVLSLPGRNRFARKAARRALRRPGRGVQQLWLRTVRESSGVIISGAGAINDDFAPHGIAAWGLIVEWAKLSGKPVALVGQGIGPVDEADSREVATRMLRNADLLTVRERFSASVAVDLGVPEKDVVVTPDWALTVFPRKEDRVAADLLRRELVGDGPFLAVSFHRRHTTTHADLRTLSSLLEKLVTGARDRGQRTLYVPNMTAGGYSDDRATAQLLMSDWTGSLRDNVTVQMTRSTPRITRALLAGATGLISTRYHPMVFAFSEATPCVGVSYDAYYDQKLGGVSALFAVSGNVHRLGSSSLDAGPVFDQLNAQDLSTTPASVVDEVRAPLRTFLQNETRR